MGFGRRRFKATNTAVERLETLKKIDPATGCWLWLGAVDTRGYGTQRYGGKLWRVHRLSYVLHVGQPVGLVCHKDGCVSKLCFNPAHLYDGTHSTNMTDWIRQQQMRT